MNKNDNTKMKLVFFGTDDFSVNILEKLHEYDLAPFLVITMPDRKAGRGLELQSPDVKVWAEKNNIEVWQPESLDADFLSKYSEYSPDIAVVASYGKIMPKEVLYVPKHKTLNVHPSLLPKWRGASPIEAQILNDEEFAGVTIMLMDEKMDHGPILEQEVVDTPYWPMRANELRTLLAESGGELLCRTITEWVEGALEPQEQDHEQATFCTKIKKEDAEINLSDDAYKNLLKIRAYSEWPRAYFFDENNKRIIITEAEMKDGELVIKKVIPEGKKEQEYKN